MAKKQSSGYTRITEKEFNNIKMLFNAGLYSNQVEQLTGRSNATISKIKASNTLADYTLLNQKYTKQRIVPEAITSDEPVVNSQNTDFNSAIDELVSMGFVEKVDENVAQTDNSGTTYSLSTTEDALLRIAKALERLADAWEAAPKKRSIF